MSTITTASNISAPTQFLRVKNDLYAYRRFGSGPGRPLLCLQHFMGTLENWDPAVTDPLAAAREVILFNNAGVGRSAGKVPATVAGMATHALNTRPILQRSPDDSRRDRAARRRRHHALGETDSGQAPR
jgi:pimeloyl-ACP methyl ester carboxylesterase